MSPNTTRIELTHEDGFALGGWAAHPATREMSRGEVRIVVEPRVMQVLVALVRANGAVLSKDDLGQSCWDGRIVGEDAINRVMSRLRRLAEETGAFRVETVTRVGYRVLVEGAPRETGASGASLAANGTGWSRRSVLFASGGALAVVGGGGFAVWKATRYRPPPEAVQLVEAAGAAINYGTPEQVATAVSSLQQATRIAPEWSAAWGFLALAYSQQAMQAPGRERAQIIERSRAAADRALKIDPANADARIAALLMRRGQRRRAQGDAEQLALLRQSPDHLVLHTIRAGFLTQVGRNRDAVVHYERVHRDGLSGPVFGFAYAVTLRAVGRADEGDAMFDRAFARWPRHYGVWFSRYKNFLYSDRADAAVAMLSNEAGRPPGIPQSNFDLCAIECRAIASRLPADIDAAMRAHMAAARTGVGYAQNAITFAAATGRLDTAFDVADAYFFDKGFAMPEQRYTREQGLYSASRLRPTYFLFEPHFAAMRADPRFLGITRGVGLEDYWREVGVQPDYRA